MKFAGGLLTMAPRAYLRQYEADVMIDDGGYSYSYYPSPSPSPPPPPPDPWEQYQTPPYIPAPLPPVYTPPPPPPPVEEIYFSLPYVDPESGASVITPHYNASTGEWIHPDVDAGGDDSDAPPPLMGTDDPFAIVADIGRQLVGGLGGGSGAMAPTTTYVPVMGGSGGAAGGSSMLIVLLVIGALGAGAWWYFRKRGGIDAG